MNLRETRALRHECDTHRILPAASKPDPVHQISGRQFKKPSLLAVAFTRT